MFSLQSPSSLMSPESIPSTMPPSSPKRTTNSDGQIDFGRDVEEEEEKEVWSGDSEEEQEVLSGSSKKECDEIDTNKERNEATENCEDKAEEPKVGMEFDTPNEAYLYYSRYAKGNGFGVAKRTSKKGRDGNLWHETIQCWLGGKARVRTSNPVKPRPQTKTECPARLNVALCPYGKWRINCIALEHNHERSPGNFRFYKSNGVLDEHLKRKLVLNDEVRIRLHKTNALGRIPIPCMHPLSQLKGSIWPRDRSTVCFRPR